MNKKMKKFFVLILTVCILFISSFSHYLETKALGIEIAVGTLAVVFVGACIVGCDYVNNPDKYSDIGDAMMDFKNTTVENQKKLYEIEKANFDYVMQKAADSGVGTCLIGSDGTTYTAQQLQSQEYPSFDTWKCYKEKQSEKPKSSLWDKFKMAAGLADLICKLWPDDSSSGGGVYPGEEQLYYTGDDGYIDRETGELSISFTAKVHFYEWTGNESTSGFRTNIYRFTCNDTIGINERVCMSVSSRGLNKLYYIDEEDGRRKQCNYRFKCYLGSLFHGSLSNCNFKNIISYSHVWSLNDMDYIDSSSVATTYSESSYSCHALDDSTPEYRLWDGLSTNIPIFESSTYAKAYMENGSLQGLINGAPDAEPTPTQEPSQDNYIGPVRQYTNYFRNTFSPSLMANYVNCNIVNNWDGDTTTFNINNYTGKESDDSGVTATPTPDLRKPTFTPIPPNSDGGDTTNNYDVNITNNLIIEQTNIIKEINQTVTNIYNFFIIDVDVISEEINTIEVLPTDRFTDFVDTFATLKSAFVDELQGNMGDSTSQFGITYPKLKVQSPSILTKYVPDDVKLVQDDKIYIVLCDCSKYAVQFSAVRTLLKALIWFGFIFYLLKQLQVVITLNG